MSKVSDGIYNLYKYVCHKLRYSPRFFESHSQPATIIIIVVILIKDWISEKQEILIYASIKPLIQTTKIFILIRTNATYDISS